MGFMAFVINKRLFKLRFEQLVKGTIEKELFPLILCISVLYAGTNLRLIVIFRCFLLLLNSIVIFSAHTFKHFISNQRQVSIR